MGTVELTSTEQARLSKWSRSAWDDKPNFDVEYASIISAKASALPKKMKKVDKGTKGSSSTVNSILDNVPTLPDDFHPIDSLLTLLTSNNDKREQSGNGQRALLCATFARADAKDLHIVLENMKVMASQCDWAVVIYPTESQSNSEATATYNNIDEKSIKNILDKFRADASTVGANLVQLDIAEPQHMVLNRYSSHTNPVGTDGQFAAGGGEGIDALARDSLEILSPDLFEQYIKHADPTILADRTGIEDNSEIDSNIKKEKKPFNDKKFSSTSAQYTSSSASTGAKNDDTTTTGNRSRRSSIWTEEHKEDMLGVIHENRGDIPLYNSHVYPKTFQYTYLLNILSKYRRIWLLDSDISLQGFNPDRFFRIIECAFEVQPIIAQPLIKSAMKEYGGKPQSYKYLNEQYWETDRSSVDAAATSFVEIQAPLLDSKYFQWFITRIVIPMLAPSHYLGADWGFDSLFCPTAALYRTLTHLPSPSRNDNNNKIKRRRNLKSFYHTLEPVCVITVGSDSVMHLNHNIIEANMKNIDNDGTASHHATTKIAATRNGKKLHEQLNKEMMKILQTTLPNFYHSGHGSENDPKSNGFTTARLDQALSKDLECKK